MLTIGLRNTFHDRVAEGFETSLKSLGLDYVDLYLMHWPQAQDAESGADNLPSRHAGLCLELIFFLFVSRSHSPA